jgi:hypothetical protein
MGILGLGYIRVINISTGGVRYLYLGYAISEVGDVSPTSIGLGATRTANQKQQIFEIIIFAAEVLQKENILAERITDT